MLVLSEVDDVSRFRDDKEFASWAGLAPSVHQSGEKTRVRSVCSSGNRRLRWVLVECAHAAVRFDPRFHGLYERVSKRRGAGYAVVAVAHEMARVMYFMLSRNEPYRAADVGWTERKFKSMGKKVFNGLR